MITRAFAALGLVAAAASAADFRPDTRTYDHVVAAVSAYEAIPPSRDGETIAKLTRDRNTNPPPYLFELSRRLLATNEQEGLYMISLASIRATYDAKRCARDVGYGVQTLHEALPFQSKGIEPYATRAIGTDRMLSVAQEIKARDEIFRSEASPWWICSYGLSVSEAAAIASHPEQWLKPKSEWIAIETQMRKAMAASIENRRTTKP